MRKLVLALDSHALSAYQRCPQEHAYAHIQDLEPAQTVGFYDKGTLVHLMLALYYRLRRRGMNVQDAAMAVATKRFTRFAKTLNLDNADEKHILARFFEYIGYYANECVRPIGIEVGFSEKIFEDKNFLFLYEGRVDWIGYEFIKNMGHTLHFTDHKTRSASYELDYFKNQFYGYAWMLRKVYGKDYDLWGKVNYFGLQEDKTGSIKKEGKLFEKTWFKFSQEQINQWEKDTIWWFHKIAQSRMYKVFPRSWQCDRQFGECAFKKLCKAPIPRDKELVLIGKNYFVKRAKPWSAWS